MGQNQGMDDGLVTHAEVLRWLPEGIRRDLQMAMPPEQRGWYTEAEIERYDGRFIAAQTMSEREPRYYAAGAVRQVFLPSIDSTFTPTTAEIRAVGA